MALFPLLIPWTQKPPLGTPIDWSNPLAQGLVGAWAFNEGGSPSAFSTVDNRRDSIVGTLYSWRSGTFEITGDASNTYIDVPDNILPVNAGTIFGVTTLPASMSADAYFVGSNSNNRRYMVYAGGTIGFRAGNGAIVGTSVTPYLGKTISYAGTYSGDATAYSTYINGALAGSGTSTANTSAVSSLGIGCFAQASNPWIGKFHIVLFFNRALSPAEIAALSANPWQIYQPQVMWVDLGGGSGTTYNQAIYGEFPAAAGDITRLIGKVLAGNIPSPSGAVVYLGDFHEPVAGSFPAPSGNVAKTTGKQVAGSFDAPTGGVSKQTDRTVTGTVPAPSGTAGQQAIFHESTSGIMGVIVGAVTTVLNPIISAGSKAMKIIGSAFRRIIGG